MTFQTIRTPPGQQLEEHETRPCTARPGVGSDEDIVGVVDYDEDIFTSKTIAQMLQDYSNLLERMVAEPDRDLTTVSLTSKQEIERLSSAFVGNLEI